MEVPPYLLPRPPMDLDAATVAAFRDLFARAAEAGSGEPVPYDVAAPKWQFLCWLADTQDVVLHGSGNPDIARFEPRQSNDVNEFGNREAIYAASDGLWPMYFAIVDRDNYDVSLSNACARVVEESGALSEPFYFFSISREALRHQPWRQGTVYILPRETFEQQARICFQGHTVDLAQWASLVPVTPLAKVRVAPEDFPFLNQIRGHDETLFERAKADPDGFPWLDDEEA